MGGHCKHLYSTAEKCHAILFFPLPLPITQVRSGYALKPQTQTQLEKQLHYPDIVKQSGGLFEVKQFWLLPAKRDPLAGKQICAPWFGDVSRL